MFKYLTVSILIFLFSLEKADGSSEKTTLSLLSKSEVSENDIVINEIMFDPTPRVNLPKAEYIEIYNRSANDIDLLDWQLMVGKKSYKLSSTTIKSGEYLLLTKDISLFTDVNTLQVNITSLTNSGTTLQLISDNDVLINQVYYNVSMFEDDIKKDGGWSLEMINPKNDCLGNRNWKGSVSINGGTPGLENSIFDEGFFPIVDTKVYQIIANDDVSSFAVLLDGFVDDTSISVATDYPSNFSTVSENMSNGSSKVTVVLNKSLESTELYFFLLENLLSCAGTTIKTDTILLSGFDVIAKRDLLVNEVMFNPKDGSSEFVEIFNNSDKFLSLRNVYLSNFTTEDGESVREGEKRISDMNIVSAPHSYFVITKNAKSVIEAYKSSPRYNFIEVSSLPKLNNDEGNIAILSPAFSFVDKMVYSSDMHVGLIPSSKQRGISLERIRSENSSLDFNNWTSASQSSGGATPGLLNSVSPFDEISEDIFEVSPEVFTPNNDGFYDVVELKYSSDKIGVVANVKIFNSNGIFIKEIANNFLMGSSGSFIWNGMNENNTLCEKGIYIFWVELFDAEGNVKSYKKICVLG
jgi:hypothetical protein